MFRAALGCLLAASLVLAVAAEQEDIDVDDGNIYDDEGRLLVVTMGAGTAPAPLSFNLTSLAGGLIPAALASWLLPLGVLAASLAISIAVPLAVVHHHGCGCGYDSGSGYGSGSGSGSGSSYGDSGGYSSYSSYRRSFDPYAIDWEKFSIIDWIAIGEEAWRKFDPADLECQKRLICEIHQNTSNFGTPAARLVDIFSYLQYAEVLSLPDEIKALIEEYNDAADRGRSMQKDCGDVYTTCDFSVKQIMEKYSHNEI